jgi:hypothetical protein
MITHPWRGGPPDSSLDLLETGICPLYLQTKNLYNILKLRPILTTYKVRVLTISEIKGGNIFPSYCTSDDYHSKYRTIRQLKYLE